jgi:hypothetical protein
VEFEVGGYGEPQLIYIVVLFSCLLVGIFGWEFMLETLKHLLYEFMNLLFGASFTYYGRI